VSKGVRDAATDSSWYDSDTKTFTDLLGTVYSSNVQASLTNPNPANSLKGGISSFQPLYITTLGDYTKSGTSLNMIYQEYDYKITGAVKEVTSAQKSAKEIQQNIEPIIQALNQVSQNLASVNTQITKINTDIIKPALDIQEIVKQQANLSFLVLFAFLMGAACFLTIIMILVAWCCTGYKCLRFFLHIVWNLVYFITILTFIIGSAFGVVGVIITDAIPAMNYLVSSQSLNSGVWIKDTSITGYIDVCLNGNGDLSAKLNLNGTYTAPVTQIYDAASYLSGIQYQFEQNKNSTTAMNLQTQYTSMKNEITLTTDNTYGNNNIGNIIGEMNKWTNYDEASSYQKSCSSNTRDMWVHNKDKCSSNQYLAAGSSNSGGSYCLSLSDWSGSQVSARYTSSPSCSSVPSSDFNSPSSAINSYYNGLTKYIADNINLLTSLSGYMDNINAQFAATANKVLGSLSNINNALKPLMELFSNNSANGISSFTKNLNCGKDI
jgi:hypothetical protein